MIQIPTLFPLVFDSTILSEINSCQMSAFRRYVQHLNGEESTDLIAGGAFAKGLEVTRKSYYDLDWDSYAAIEAGKEACREAYGDHEPKAGSVKTKERMAQTVEEYFFEYPMDRDHIQPTRLESGKYGIEYSFIHELPFKHPQLGIPLLFAGRADMLCEYAGKLWVSDEKTTSQITATWDKQWATRGQFTGYSWGLRKAGIDVAGAYVRGIGLYKAQTKFVETTTTRSKFEVDTWEQQMLNTIARFLAAYTAFMLAQTPKSDGSPDLDPHPSNYFPGAWNEACFKYFRPCWFQDSCKTPNSEGLLYMNTEQHIWLPHRHTRMPLQEFLQELRDKGANI
jgi:hypothetical protein